MGIDYEAKVLFYDILKAVVKKCEFEYSDDKMIELSKRIKLMFIKKFLKKRKTSRSTLSKEKRYGYE